MTLTETPPEVESAAPADDSSPAPSEAFGLADLVGSGDHKVIGRLFIGFSLVFGLLSQVLGELVAVDRIDGTIGDTVLSSGTAFQVATLAVSAEVFLFVVPLFIGIAFVVVPLQVGSQAIAFPRAASASFWGWLVGSGIYLASFAMNGGPGGGSSDGVSLWLLSYGMVVASLLLGAACVATTVVALRAPGMGLDRTPFFSWAMLAAASVWLLSLPVLLAVIVLSYVDHRYGQVFLGINGAGLWNRLSWVFTQPQIYVLAVPALGFVADVVPVAARTRQAARGAVIAAIGGFAILGFGAYVQPQLFEGARDNPVYVFQSVVILLPVLGLFGAWVSTLGRGRPRFSTPLLFAVCSALLGLVAVLFGAMRSIDRLDLVDTVFDDGQRNATVVAALIAAVGALWYWAPKITGRLLPDGLGKLTAVVLLLGGLLVALPDALSGAFGEDGELTTGIEALNGVLAAGRGLVSLGVLLALLGLAAGTRGSFAADDPWDGHTLEWATTSPPSATNFDGVPVVESAEPLLDAAEKEAAA